MATQNLAEVKEGSTFSGQLWVTSSAVKTTSRGDPYWEGILQDATAALSAKLWDSQGKQKGRVSLFKALLVPGRVVKVAARAESFRDKLQLTVQAVEGVDSSRVDPSRFSPRSRRTTADMVRELDDHIASVSDPDCLALLSAFRSDESLFRAFIGAPAAKSIHHAWVGGLLEHVLSLARSVRGLAPNYPGLDGDLLLCACLFHDLGKVREISSLPGFEYTTDGKLHGHIYMGARFLEKLCDGLNAFPEEKRRHLLHLVLSHQGDRADGFGSPVDPATPEAVFFHHLDNLDAKMQHCMTALDEAAKQGAEGDFTPPKYGPIRKTYYRTAPDGETRGGAPSPAEGGPPDEGPRGREGEEGEGDHGNSPQPRLW